MISSAMKNAKAVSAQCCGGVSLTATSWRRSRAASNRRSPKASLATPSGAIRTCAGSTTFRSATKASARRSRRSTAFVRQCSSATNSTTSRGAYSLKERSTPCSTRTRPPKQCVPLKSSCGTIIGIPAWRCRSRFQSRCCCAKTFRSATKRQRCGSFLAAQAVPEFANPIAHQKGFDPTVGRVVAIEADDCVRLGSEFAREDQRVVRTGALLPRRKAVTPPVEKQVHPDPVRLERNLYLHLLTTCDAAVKRPRVVENTVHGSVVFIGHGQREFTSDQIVRDVAEQFQIRPGIEQIECEMQVGGHAVPMRFDIHREVDLLGEPRPTIDQFERFI